MSTAKIHYYYSTKHPRKPFRLEVEVVGADVSYTLDCHGRFRNQREASEVGRDIGCRYDTWSEDWGRIVTENEPPKIETID